MPAPWIHGLVGSEDTQVQELMVPASIRRLLRDVALLLCRQLLGPRLTALQPAQPSQRDRCRVLLWAWLRLRRLSRGFLDDAECDLIQIRATVAAILRSVRWLRLA